MLTYSLTNATQGHLTMDQHPSSQVDEKRENWAKAFMIGLILLTIALVVMRIFFI